jgi:hypothetical protein
MINLSEEQDEQDIQGWVKSLGIGDVPKVTILREKGV